MTTAQADTRNWISFWVLGFTASFTVARFLWMVFERQKFIREFDVNHKYRASRQRGIFLVLFAITFVIMALLLGVAIDSGRTYLLRAELERTVDSAALAAAYRLSAGIPAAQSAACNAALMNGVTCGNLVVSPTTVPDPMGVPVNAVRVTATSNLPLTFSRIGSFIGCGSRCQSRDVIASAVAAPGGTIDLVMNLDDTRSMLNDGWIGPAKIGAKALVNALVPAMAQPTNAGKVSMVPFRGCYNNSGADACENQNEYAAGDIVSLSTSNVDLRDGIDALTGQGGSGTNNCEGLVQARRKLFQVGTARPTAMKYMVVLTDAESNYSTDASFARCIPPSGSGINPHHVINLRAYQLAQDIKNGNPSDVILSDVQNGVDIGVSGQLPNQTVKVFVIIYGSSGPAPADCTQPPLSATTQWNTTPLNLGRCMASSAGDLYFAPTPQDIQTVFQQIIGRLPVRILN